MEFSQEPTLQDVEAPHQLYQRKAAEAATEQATKYHTEDKNWLERRFTVMSRGFETNLTTSALKWGQEQFAQSADPSLLPDPNYNSEQYEADLTRALKEEGISPQFLSTLEGAQSRNHMYYLIERAKQRQKVFQELQEYGLEGSAMALVGNILDPAALAVGAAGGAASAIGILNAGRAYQATRAGQMATLIAAYTGAGAGGNVAIEAARALMNVDPVETNDYLWAAGLGGLFGLGAGIVRVQPAGFKIINQEILDQFKNTIARGGGNVVNLSRRAKAAILRRPVHIPERPVKVKDFPSAPPKDPVINEAPVIREDIADIGQPVAAEPAFKVDIPNPLNPGENIEVSIGTRAPDAPLPETPPIQVRASGQIDEAVPTAQSAQAVDAQVRSQEVERKLTVLEDSAKDLKNPRYVSAYKAPDGAEYKLMVAPGPDSSHVGGPYLAFRQGPGEKGFKKFGDGPYESLDQLKAAILGESALGQVSEVPVPKVELSGNSFKVSLDTPEGLNMGYVRGTVKDGVATIDDTFLAQQLRGQSVGYGMYKALIDAVQKTGLQLRSSHNLSADARKLYERLGKEYPMFELPDTGQFQIFKQIEQQIAIKNAMDDLPANYADIEDFYASQGKDVPLKADADVVKASFFIEMGADVPTAVALAKSASIPGLPESALPKGNNLSAARAPTLPEIIKDPDWKAIGRSNPPRSGSSGWFGFMNYTRFDRAGLAGGHKASPPGRLLGPALMNESIGMTDGSAVPRAAIVDKDQLFKGWWNEVWQTYDPALKEYMKENNLALWDRGRALRDFDHEVYKYVTNIDPSAQYPQSVVRAGNALRESAKKILQKAKDPGITPGSARPVQGAEDIAEDPFYLWRKWDHHKIREATQEFGQEPIQELLAHGFRISSPNLSVAESQRLAKYFYQALHKRAVGLVDEWNYEFGQGNYLQFRRLLENETAFTPDEIENLMSKMVIKQQQPSATNMRRRALISNQAEIKTTTRHGMEKTIRMIDLIDTSSSRLHATYARRMAGRVAMARLKIADPNTGDLWIDGITSDAEWGQVMTRLKEWHAENGSLDMVGPDGLPSDHRLQSTGIASLGELQNLQFAYDRILGRPDPEQLKNYAQAMRMARGFMSTRLMGQVGFAQLGETSFPVAHLGLDMALKKMPAMRRLMSPEGKKLLTDPLFQELEAIGIGGERLHGFFWNTVDEIGDLPFDMTHLNSRLARQAEEGLRMSERAVYELSGMSYLQQQQQRWVGSMFVNWFANTAKKFSKGDIKRLKQLGIDEDMLKRIQSQVDAHSNVETGSLFGKKITRLNLLDWDDLEARHALEHGAFRAANKFIQTSDPTNSAWWMSNPIMQTLLQFRSFPQTAYANQFLYNLHVADPKALMSFIGTMVFASATRALQVWLKSQGRSDGDRYREKYLTTAELAKAGFERSGWSSIIPGVLDQASVWSGGEAIFNARTSGDPTGFISGSPVVGFARDAQAGLAGVRRGITGGPPMAQTEARRLLGLLPFSNLVGVTNGLNLMISPLPERAPYRYGK